MQQNCRTYLKLVFLVLLPILILSGCAASSAAQPTESQTPTGLIAVEFTVAPPAYDPSQAGLTVVESIAKVFGDANTITEVLQDQAVNVQVDDRIELDEQGRSILKFPDVLDVELFRNAIILLTGLKHWPTRPFDWAAARTSSSAMWPRWRVEPTSSPGGRTSTGSAPCTST